MTDSETPANKNKQSSIEMNSQFIVDQKFQVPSEIIARKENLIEAIESQERGTAPSLDNIQDITAERPSDSLTETRETLYSSIYFNIKQMK